MNFGVRGIHFKPRSCQGLFVLPLWIAVYSFESKQQQKTVNKYYAGYTQPKTPVYRGSFLCDIFVRVLQCENRFERLS